MQEAVRTPVSVILPAYNEQAAVGSQVEAIRRVLCIHGIVHEIIVVDDGSEDLTAEEASRAGARVIRHPKNCGYGAAIKTGISVADYETLVIIDADGTYPPDQIPTLVAKLETSDMVVGARIGKQVYIPWARRPAKWLLRWLAARIVGQSIHDLNSGLRTFRRACVQQYFPILSNQFSFTTTMTLALLADEYRVVYHPIDYYQRVGHSKIKPRHFMDFVILVLRMAMLFQPLKIFAPLALLCSSLGVVKGVFDILLLFPRISTVGWATLLYQPILSTSSILLLLVGLQLLLSGMTADALLRQIARGNKPLTPSRGMTVSETYLKPQIEKENIMLTVKE